MDIFEAIISAAGDYVKAINWASLADSCYNLILALADLFKDVITKIQ